MIVDLEAATDDDPLRPHEVEELARRSGGNPAVPVPAARDGPDHRTIDVLPDSIESLIAGEIDQLAPADRTILRYAVVLGTTFDPRCSSTAFGRTSTWTTRSGPASDLLLREPNGELRFRSTLVRDAAYEGLPYRRRRALHDRVGETIEATAGRHPRRGDRRPRPALPRGPAVGQGVDVLPARRRPGDGGLRQRRSDAVLRQRAGRGPAAALGDRRPSSRRCTS